MEICGETACRKIRDFRTHIFSLKYLFYTLVYSEFSLGRGEETWEQNAPRTGFSSAEFMFCGGAWSICETSRQTSLGAVRWRDVGEKPKKPRVPIEFS